MDILDVNVLLYAYNENASQHELAKRYVQSLREGSGLFAIPAVVFAAFLRVITNPKAVSPPAGLDDAIRFCEQFHELENCLTVVPGRRHWQIFLDLCRRGNARANLISDAYLAAIAVESGGVLITADRGMARWPGLHWRDPFNEAVR